MSKEIRSASMAEPDKTTIGARIRYIRGSLTKIEFCRELGIFRNTLQKWEANKGFPVFESLLKLHKQFKVNINWLISGEGKPYLKRLQYPPDIENRIIKMESRITALEKKAKK
jgi:transcriptional regulator with XRE-family HTH domain